MTVLSLDIIGGGSGVQRTEQHGDSPAMGQNNFETDGESNQDFIINETPHILRPTKCGPQLDRKIDPG